MYRIGQEEIDAVARAINTKDFFKINNSGCEVLNFENELKEHIGSNHALLMTSGFGALTSALIGLGIGPGDEVIVPAYTYIASALAVVAVGAIPVIVEVDETLTIDPIEVEKKISKNTKAVMPVHIMGFPANMAELKKLSEKHNIAIVEDACQSMGGKFNGKFLGTIGDAGAYSYNYYKIMTSGEGGALVTNNKKIFERALIYHDSSAVAFFGSQLDGITERIFGGTEFRVSDITGAILREQLKKLDTIIGDLHKVKFTLIDKLAKPELVAPSHDSDGDCATTIALRFNSVDECNKFAADCEENGFSVVIPINTGKHIYTNWTQIMEKRGALHPAMDPFKLKENQGLQMDYTMDMCPRTLDLLARTAYINLSPDWLDEEIDDIANKINASF